MHKTRITRTLTLILRLLPKTSLDALPPSPSNTHALSSLSSLQPRCPSYPCNAVHSLSPQLPCYAGTLLHSHCNTGALSPIAYPTGDAVSSLLHSHPVTQVR